jgi:hypothetical protein
MTLVLNMALQEDHVAPSSNNMCTAEMKGTCRRFLQDEDTVEDTDASKPKQYHVENLRLSAVLTLAY